MPTILSRSIVVAAIAALAPIAAFADAKQFDPQMLKGTWVVDGADWIRLLQIRNINISPDGSIAIDATYGFGSTLNDLARVALDLTTDNQKISITTKANSLVALNEATTVAYNGTFTNRIGTIPVTMTKLNGLPDQDIPPSCTSFVGVWEGKWENGNIGIRTMAVTGMTKECVALVTYGRFKDKVKISDEKLSFLCNTDTGGTCNFKRVGDDIHADYSNPQGGWNRAVLKRIELVR
jgi:hypothetical protein